MIRPTVRAAGLAVLLGLGLAAAHADGSSSGTITASIRVDGGIVVSLELARDKLRQAQPFEVKARIANATGAQLSETAVVLRGDTGRLAIKGGEERRLHDLGPGKSGVVSWSVCTDQPGAYVLLASLTARLNDGAVRAESSLAVVADVAKQPGKECPPGFGASD